jgi:hypothetical protein
VLATLNQLKESFLKAHKAGDVENAKILAAEIRRLQQTTPAQPAEVFGIPPQQLTQDLPEPPPAVKPLQEAFKYVYGRDVEQAKPILSGAYKGLAGLASLPSLVEKGAEFATEYVTGLPSGTLQKTSIPTKFPTYEEITSLAETIPGAEAVTQFKPRTEAEKYAERISEFTVPGGPFVQSLRALRNLGILGTVGGTTSVLTEPLGPIPSSLLTLGTTLGAGFATQPSRAARYAREALENVSEAELRLAKIVENKANKLGIRITAPELIDNKILQGVGNIVYGSEKGGQIMYNYVKNRPEEINKVADRLVEQMAKEPESLRKVFADVGTTAKRAMSEAKKERAITAKEQGYDVSNTESISENQVLSIIDDIDSEILKLPKGPSQNKLKQLKTRLIKKEIKPEPGITLLDERGNPIPQAVATTRIIPETNIRKLDSIMKEFRDAVVDSRANQATDRRFVQKEAQAILTNDTKSGILDNLDRELKTNPNFARAKSEYARLSDEIVNTTQDNLEVLLKGGVTPSKIKSFIFDADKNNVKDIQKTYTLLNKQDKSVFPNLARTYVRNAADKAFIIKPEGVSLKSGFDLYKALAGTPRQKANFNQVLKGVADANGANPNDLISGFNNFNAVLKRTARLANIDNPQMPPDARNLPQQIAQIGSFMWQVKFASQYSKLLQDKTMADLANVFTKKESVKALIELAKKDPKSNDAVNNVVRIIAISQGLEPQEQQVEPLQNE